MAREALVPVNTSAAETLKPMTTRLRILDAVRVHYQRHGTGTTMRELVGDCGLSSTAVASHHVGVLRRLGYVRPAPRDVSRVILPVVLGWAMVNGTDCPAFAPAGEELARERLVL